LLLCASAIGVKFRRYQLSMQQPLRYLQQRLPPPWVTKVALNQMRFFTFGGVARSKWEPSIVLGRERR
jgi:hypothetical protein